MLDYNGYISLSKDQIKDKLITIPLFKQYSEGYISCSIDSMYSNKNIHRNNSYGGWAFTYNDVQNKLNGIIYKDIINNKKKIILVMYLKNNKYMSYEPELFRNICDYIQ